MSRAVLRANKMLSELGLDASEHLHDLEAICFHIGVPVKYAPLRNSEGTLTVCDSKGIITINSREDYLPRIRFSIAHELGHFELHRNLMSQFLCNEIDMNAVTSKIAQKIEVEANEFAASFLMPNFLVLPGIKGKNPSIQTVELLSEKFGTSLTAAARRFVELSDEACAVVYFNSNRSIYAVKSNAFKDQNYYIEYNLLDQYSEAAKAVLGKQCKHMTSIDADCWIENLPSSKKETMIKEQAVYFERFDLGISIIQLTGDLLRF